MTAATALLLAVQVAVATPPATPTVLVLRNAASETVIPLARTNAGPSLPADALSPILPVTVTRVSDGRFTLVIGAVELKLTEQVPFAVLGEEIIPLAAAPYVEHDRLFVPLQLVVEIIPRLVGDLAYDGLRNELRVLSGSPSGAAPAARATAAPRTAAPAPRTVPPAPGTAAARKRTVIVDAGHGGVDPGTFGVLPRGERVREKDLTLAVALRLRETLLARGVEVHMTRHTDTLVALSDRGRFANGKRGDLFVSIHANAANPRWREPAAARGVETFFLAEAKTEDEKRVEEMENEVVRFETGVNAPRDDPLSFVIADMAQNEHLRESAELAAIIQTALSSVHPGPNRGVKQAGFRVLMTAYMPAVLVEIGFITNREDAAYLNSERGQRQVATAIADAVVRYLDHYERRIGAGSR